MEWLVACFSIIGGKLADCGVQTVTGINDFKHILETVETNLNLLRAKASDVKESTKNAQAQLSSKKKKIKSEVENWLEEVPMVEKEFELVRKLGFIKRRFGHRAARLKERVDRLLQQHENFGELVFDDNEAKGDPLPTTKLIGKSSGDNLEKIWKLMVVDKKVPSVGIYGMGGVGKTTLAKQIHNRLLKETQYNVYWVTVSQAFSIKGLQDGIAKAMNLNPLDEDNEDKRAAILNRALSQRKDLVLILDDIWENISLEKLGDPPQVEGCRLIITSRYREVCCQIGCQQVFFVETLHTDDAWDLFRKTLNLDTELDPQVEEIAKRLVKKCDGLPLGIIVLAGSMRGLTNIHVWRNTLVELEESLFEQNEMEDKVFEVLKFSFDRLDPNYQREGRMNGYTHMQLCFLYCSLFPEDKMINRNDLICYFISEKMMGKRKTREEEFDLGHVILDKLVNVCLLQKHANNSFVNMHDLVRCMALKIACGNPRFMVYAGLSLKEIPNEEEWTEDLDKVSLMENEISELPAGISPNCPKLTTLLLNDNPLEFIPESFFLRMSGLHVLDLSGTEIKELPNSLSDLERLNALLLTHCRYLVSVPYLGKLKALEKLDLSYTTRLEQVPEGMENLVNLKYLCWFGFSKMEMFPTGLLSKYHHLQHLGLSTDVQAPAKEVGNLKKLEQFCGRFGAIGDLNQFTRSRQSQGSRGFYGIYVGVSDEEGYGYENLVVNDRKVTMQECSLRGREYEDDMILLPEDIEELEFVECEGLSSCLLDDLARRNILRSLKNLRIERCEGIECISNEQLIISLEEDDEPAYSNYHSVLPTLEQIVLYRLPNFKSMYGIGFFSSLKSLRIYECHKIKKLGLRGADIQNLEEIWINDCAEIEEILQVEDDRSREERVSLPKLKKLQLCFLPRLNSICKAKMVCSSIESIELEKCKNLKKMPVFVPRLECESTVPLAPLHISIRWNEKEWWESMEWEHPIQHELTYKYW